MTTHVEDLLTDAERNAIATRPTVATQPIVRVVSRAEWGARPPRAVTVDAVTTEAYLHHTAGAGNGAQYMRAMQDYHMGKGWNDIAYNYVVDPDSLEVYEGRGAHVRPGAQYGYNRGTVAVCVMGDYRTKPATDELYAVLALVMRALYQNDAGPALFTGGHRDAPGQSTSCPAELDYRQVNALLEGTPPPTPPEPVPPTEGLTMQVSRVLVSARTNDRHPDVRIAQGLLTAFSPVSPGAADGIAGPQFDASARAWQTSAGLVADGALGAKSWPKLEDAD